MTARDDYPWLERYRESEWERMCDEIDRLRRLHDAVHNTSRKFGRTEIPGANIRFQDPDGIIPFLQSIS